MSIASSKTIEWDAILETYGPEAKTAISRLLAEAQISEFDPAAVIIAALFISQIDSNKAFQSIAETIDSGKEELSKQFQQQVEQLRGVVTYAEEHLVQTNEKQVEKHQSELIAAVKTGIVRVLGKESQSRHQKSLVANSLTIVFAAIVSIAGMAAGASIVYVAMSASLKRPVPISTSDIEALPNGDRWLDIAEFNQDRLDTCLANLSALEGRCAIIIPD